MFLFLGWFQCFCFLIFAATLPKTSWNLNLRSFQHTELEHTPKSNLYQQAISRDSFHRWRTGMAWLAGVQHPIVEVLMSTKWMKALFSFFGECEENHGECSDVFLCFQGSFYLFLGVKKYKICMVILRDFSYHVCFWVKMRTFGFGCWWYEGWAKMFLLVYTCHQAAVSTHCFAQVRFALKSYATSMSCF